MVEQLQLSTFSSQPILGIMLTLVCYYFGIKLQQKTKSVIANPMLIATIMIIILLKIFKIPLNAYKVGGEILSFLVGPATVALAVPMCKQIEKFKDNMPAILFGTFIGALTGIVSSAGLALITKVSDSVFLSLLPKSVTTPIAMALAEKIGGIPALAAAVVAIAGITGALIGPEILHICGVQSEIAKGIAMGSASHALGTTRALQESELQGAMSSISIALVGTTTAIIAPILVAFFR
ncbi:MAG TPA: LrgB family protein [Clostridia bacterium]|nr:LrgB family protein [Clostridia bacterium]